MRGVIAPVPTPFGPDLAPDARKFTAFCRVLVHLGLGLVPFGTTGEGTSLSVDEKLALLDALAGGGVPMGQVMAGTGACALPDAARLTAHAVKLGCGGALMLPPFYFKGVSEEGLFRFYAEVIERVGDARLRLYLYHFPLHAGVGIGHGLIARLLKAYPATVVGIKDSSGDFARMESVCRAFPGFDLFTGSDALMLKVLRAGGAGCIATNANINGAAMVELHRRWRDDDADLLQDAIAAFSQAMAGFPLVPSVKALVAMASGDDAWRLVRPPLEAMPASEDAAITARLAEAGYPLEG
ncbi:MAG: dihydrodipicolinate synthase family protein [Pseudomonadota bacterium]